MTQLYSQQYTHRPKRPQKGHRSLYMALGYRKAYCEYIAVNIIESSYLGSPGSPKVPPPRVLLAPPGSSWLLLAVPGSPWLLLAPPGSSWLSLAPPGSSWLLLAVPGSSWDPLAPPGSLGPPGCARGGAKMTQGLLGASRGSRCRRSPGGQGRARGGGGRRGRGEGQEGRGPGGRR